MRDGPRDSARRRALLSLLLGLSLATPAMAYDLAQHLWRDRLLVLAAPTADDAALQARLADVHERRDAVEDRDLRVFELYPAQGRRDGEALSTAEVGALRDHFRLGEDDRLLILVGLDGGEKRRVSLDTHLRELYLQIDAMPMRRADIRAKEAAGIRVTDP
jgi:hypothetical protein